MTSSSSRNRSSRFEKTDIRSVRGLVIQCVLYTSISGFIAGIAFGYLHLIGWIPNAEEGLFLYAITIGIIAIISLSVGYYQFRQSQDQMVKVRSKID